MNITPLEKTDYDEIVRVIDHWWGGPTSALAHPIFYYELGQLARAVKVDGSLIGFLLGFICPGAPIGYVHLVGIAPKFRRRGVARLLYKSFEDDCRRESCTSLKAITTLGNEGSIRFHQSLGWLITEVEDYAGPGRLRVVLTKDLVDR